MELTNLKKRFKTTLDEINTAKSTDAAALLLAKLDIIRANIKRINYRNSNFKTEIEQHVRDMVFSTYKGGLFAHKPANGDGDRIY